MQAILERPATGYICGAAMVDLVLLQEQQDARYVTISETQPKRHEGAPRRIPE
jgi:hypothetical protein